MGNNNITGPIPRTLIALRNLQRIVLHQNSLSGIVPTELGELGCIVNLAGNVNLEHGVDVPLVERNALIDLYKSTKGNKWISKTNWLTDEPVHKWYKVS